MAPRLSLISVPACLRYGNALHTTSGMQFPGTTLCNMDQQEEEGSTAQSPSRQSKDWLCSSERRMKASWSSSSTQHCVRCRRSACSTWTYASSPAGKPRGASHPVHPAEAGRRTHGDRRCRRGWKAHRGTEQSEDGTPHPSRNPMDWRHYRVDPTLRRYPASHGAMTF